MQKPSGYDEAKASGEYIPVDLGGHYCTIKQVSELQSSTGKDMIVVVFDFCEPDQQVGYFAEQFANDTRNEKKWPYQGTKYILVNDFQDAKKTSKQFKTFCTCVENSNNYKIQWGGQNWAQQFKGKKIGAIFGEEESEYDGKTSMRRVLRWFCGTDKVNDAKIPEPKYIKSRKNDNMAATSKDTGFMNIPDDADEEIPF